MQPVKTLIIKGEEVLHVDAAWLFILFRTEFQTYRFPSVSDKAIKIRNILAQIPEEKKRRSHRKKVSTRRKNNSTWMPRKTKDALTSNRFVFILGHKPIDTSRKNKDIIIHTDRVNDYCGVLRMEDVHKLHSVELCLDNYR